MLEKEYIEKFEKIVSFYEISQSDIYDITRAISFAESFGTHPIRLKDLAVSGVDYFTDIVSNPKDATPLPDTRVMRILSDTLTVVLFISNTDIFTQSGVADIAGLLSSNTGSVLVEAIKLRNPSIRDYLHLSRDDHYKTVDECKKVLDLLEATCISEDDNEDLFNFISESLRKLRNLSGVAEKGRLRIDDDLSSIYLPKKYDSHDYRVLTKAPIQLKGTSKEELESWELIQLMNVLLQFFTGRGTEEIDKVFFVRRLVRIHNKYLSLTPIGVGASESLYIPKHFMVNQIVEGMYNTTFNPKVPLTRESIDRFFELCRKVFEIEEDL